MQDLCDFDPCSPLKARKVAVDPVLECELLRLLQAFGATADRERHSKTQIAAATAASAIAGQKSL